MTRRTRREMHVEPQLSPVSSEPALLPNGISADVKFGVGSHRRSGQFLAGLWKAIFGDKNLFAYNDRFRANLIISARGTRPIHTHIDVKRTNPAFANGFWRDRLPYLNGYVGSYLRKCLIFP